MTRTEAPATTAEESSVVAKLSTLDRFLAVWILVAMAVGLGLGRMVPGMGDALAHLEVGGISLPIALGLLVMMYPVLAKVRYDRPDAVTGDKRLMVSSLVINWLVGPAIMFALAWIFPPDLPEYRTGLIIVGLARCIAMVIIRDDLACGDREAAAVLVALNSVFQVIAFGLLGWFYLDLLPQWLGLGDGQGLDVSVWKIALNVVVFLGIPLLAGFLTRRIGEERMGRESYERKFLPKIGPWALYGLLFTIVVLFALQGKTITSQPLDVVRIALPLLVYFAVMWAGTFSCWARRSAWPTTARPPSPLHRRRQQLRAGHRRRHRHLRRDLRPGPLGRRGTPHRGARTDRPRPRVPGLAQEVRPVRRHHRGKGLLTKGTADPCAPRRVGLPDGQQLPHGRQHRRFDAVVDPGSAPLGGEQPGLLELLQVVGDGRLGDADVGDVADARLTALVRGDGREQPQPYRVPERLEHPRGPLGLLGGEGALAQRRAARHRGAGGLGFQKRQCRDIRHTPMLTHVETVRTPPVS